MERTTIWFLSGLRPSLLALVLFLFTSSLFSQAPPLDPPMEIFPPSSYGGGPQVLSLKQGPKGGIWAGVEGHVLHYDGHEWRRIPTGPGMPAQGLAIDQKGRVWVAARKDIGYIDVLPPDSTGERGMTQDPRKKTTPHNLNFVSLFDQIPDSIKLSAIWDVNVFTDRAVFNGRSHLLVKEADSMRIIPVEGAIPYMDRTEDHLWAKTRGRGLYRLDTLAFEKALKNGKLPEASLDPSFSDLFITAIETVPSDPEKVFIGSRRGKVFRYDPTKQEAELFYSPNGPPGPQISDLTVVDPRTNQWKARVILSTLNRGILLLDQNGRIRKQLHTGNGFSADLIWKTIQGKEGSGLLWSGTDQGITRWGGSDPFSFAYEGEAIDGNLFQVERFRDRLFVATTQGVSVRKKKASAWKKVPGSDIQCTSLRSIHDELFVGGPQNTRKLVKKKGEWRAKKAFPHDSRALAIYSSKNRDTAYLGIGGSDGLALYRKDGRKKAWKGVLHMNGLPGHLTSLVLEKPDNEERLNIWGSFRTKGILWTSLPLKEKEALSLSKAGNSEKNGSFPLKFRFPEFQQMEGKEKEALEARIFAQKELPFQRFICYKAHDRAFMASDSGIFRASSEHGAISELPADKVFQPDPSFGERFSLPKGKKDPHTLFVDFLKTDSSGSTWLSNKKSIYRIAEKGEEPKIHEEPFRSLELGKLRDVEWDQGVYWLALERGLARYEPEIPKAYDRPFECLIRNVHIKSRKGKKLKNIAHEERDSMIFGGNYRKSTPNDPLLPWRPRFEQSSSNPPRIEYQDNGLVFKFAAPFHEDQNKIRYSYRLKGFQDHWSPWRRDNEKEYTNLTEGSYTFEVKARNIYGKESSTASFRFRILPPWYRTQWAYAGYGILSIFLLWFISRLRAQRAEAQKRRLEKIVAERTQEIRDQKDRVEEAHREITDSINYAQKIQYALLQSEEYVSPHLPEHFILFKPQAKVSGDFYWVREQGDHLYVAAVDCTGHGVPGAFMSMLGISQLNEIMAAHDDPSPGEVLTDLRKRVVAELSTGDPEGGAKDGMDAALVKIPISGSQSQDPKPIEFAGANNPLYVVKEGISKATKDLSGPSDLTGLGGSDRLKPFKKSSDGFEVKGDKMAVGYEPDAADAFTTVEMEVPAGAMLYLFSDGYADQFGGPKGKKFRYGPFKELLARIHTMDPEEQKPELDRVFEEWRQGQEQVDDVCVVGIRLNG